jgi:hypothetical protein
VIAIRREIVASLVVSIVATIWAGVVAGPGLAVYLGAPLLACLYVPFLSVGDHSFKRAMACAIGIAVVLAAFNFRADVAFGEWIRCVIVITALVIALTAIANLLAWLRVAPAIAATLTSIVALLWMTWPVWMSHALTQTRVDWLVWPHPLLAINGVLEHLGAWDHSPIAYRQLTILNQDIPFRLPTSVIPTAVSHALLGALLLLPRSRSKAGGPIEPPARDAVMA